MLGIATLVDVASTAITAAAGVLSIAIPAWLVYRSKVLEARLTSKHDQVQHSNSADHAAVVVALGELTKSQGVILELLQEHSQDEVAHRRRAS